MKGFLSKGSEETLKICSDKEEEEKNSSGKLTYLSGIKYIVREEKENRSGSAKQKPDPDPILIQSK